MELISIIIGLAGFLFGAYAYYKNRATKELTVIYSSELIEGKQKPGVEMLYLGKPISDFVRYEITLFNSGRGELRPVDFQKGIAVRFDNLQVVSNHQTYASKGIEADYQVNDHDINIGFGRFKRNNHITFEVLAGAHSRDLNPPVVSAELINGKPIKLHHQSFEQEVSDQKYQALVKHLGIICGAFIIGLILLITSFYSKYSELLAGADIDLREQLNVLLSVNSLLWFFAFLVSMVLLIFSYESLRVLSPKFQRYKFEQLVQNKH